MQSSATLKSAHTINNSEIRFLWTQNQFRVVYRKMRIPLTLELLLEINLPKRTSTGKPKVQNHTKYHLTRAHLTRSIHHLNWRDLRQVHRSVCFLFPTKRLPLFPLQYYRNILSPLLLKQAPTGLDLKYIVMILLWDLRILKSYKIEFMARDAPNRRLAKLLYQFDLITIRARPTEIQAHIFLLSVLFLCLRGWLGLMYVQMVAKVL